MSIARKMAEVANAAGIILNPHWFTRTENIVYDCLSRDHNLTNTQLVTMLCFFVPTQIAEDFTISPLHHEIISFLSSLLTSTPGAKPSPKAPQKMQCAHGSDGLSFVNQSEWYIRYWSSSASTKDTGLLAPSTEPCEKASSRPVSSLSSDFAPVAPQWTMWHRP
jgi:hypothetical protein